jgi:hypothetical protein
MFMVESSDAAVLQLAVDAFGRLPPYKREGKRRRFRVRLVLSNHHSTWARKSGPPAPLLTGHDGLLCATVDAGNFALVDVPRSRALVSLSPSMLRFPYHARYELIELAIVTLASRAQSLVPLHAACVGLRRAGILLMGASGAGKSTLALHALCNGMQVLSEDSAFVDLPGLRVMGLPNYLHLQPNALGLLPRGPLLDEIRRSPIIERRSGARKYELDLRNVARAAPPAPLQLAATVFVSRRKATRRNAVMALDREELLTRLRREQPYAAGLSNWRSFEGRIARLPAFELRRADPNASIRDLRTVLAAVRGPS